MEDRHSITPLNSGANMQDPDFQQHPAIFNHTNQIIRGWQAIAEELLGKYEESFEKIPAGERTLADDFEFVSYDAIRKNLNLPGNLQVIDNGVCVTMAINLQNRARNVLRLYLCSIGVAHIPEKIYAALHYQFGRQISFMEEDVNGDLRVSNQRFREWFADQMDAMIKYWLDHLE